jgi:hypothetical protein
MPRKRWSELPPGRRRGLIAAGLVQVALAAVAWTDLARRPRDRVRGSKTLWAVAITVNFAGPVAYLCWGRKKDNS